MTIIRSINDLAQLPDDELRACLTAMAKAIQAQRAEHAARLTNAAPPLRPRFNFQSFDWQAHSNRLDIQARLQPDALIDELPLRPAVKARLRELSIYCLEDLAAISEEELLAQDEIGGNTVAKLRALLGRAALDFLPAPATS